MIMIGGYIPVKRVEPFDGSRKRVRDRLNALQSENPDDPPSPRIDLDQGAKEISEVRWTGLGLRERPTPGLASKTTRAGGARARENAVAHARERKLGQ